MENQHKKPSRSYGHISFSKDGRVEKKLFELPAEKKELELLIIHHFVTSRFPNVKISETVFRLNEHDNDFKIVPPNEDEITIELTEIVRQDYKRKLTREEYDSGKYTMVEYRGIDDFWEINRSLLDQVLIKKIESKRRYQKPEGRFWLLIWTAESDYAYCWNESNEDRSVTLARDHVESIRDFIYDEVWVTYTELAPHRVWPKP